jgi:catechol 2,3-dioxygenase-like lactoylglutathione lyase family enzyme
MIKGLHHNAYRCRDSEETRRFYEDLLGLPLVHSILLEETKTGREVEVLHTFYRMGDGSCLAFFEAPNEPFEFKQQRDFDLHIALEVEASELASQLDRARIAGVEVRGVVDHHFIDSIYLRDPNGYVIELTSKREDHDVVLDPALNGARQILDDWLVKKSSKRGAA